MRVHPVQQAGSQQRQPRVLDEHAVLEVETEANPDCTTYDRCIEDIPPAAELAPGELARATKACMRAKTDECRAAEDALERARAENVAVLAELQAASARLVAATPP